MTSPLRLSPLAPPPMPSFVKARPGTLPGAVARDAQSPGFALALANIKPARDVRQHTAAGFDGLANGLVETLQNSYLVRARGGSLQCPPEVGVDGTEVAELTAAKKADLAFHLMLQIRNKLMDAYREIQQIQI